MSFLPLSILAASLIAAQTNSETVLRTAGEVSEFLCRDEPRTLPFDISTTVVIGNQPGDQRTIAAADADGSCVVDIYTVITNDTATFRPGDRVHLTGLAVGRSDYNIPALITSVQVCGRAAPAELPLVDAHALVRGTFNHRPVRLRGLVTACFEDEIDPEWAYLALNADGVRICAFFPRQALTVAEARRFIDAEIELTGICSCLRSGARQLLGPYMRFWFRDAIRVLTPAPADPFSVPRLEDLRCLSATTVARLGRRQAEGTVLAAWNGCRLLLGEDGGRIVDVRLAENELPEPGQRIAVSGLPQTDVYHNQLLCAIWKPAEAPPAPAEPPIATTAGFVMTDTNRITMVKAEFHGRAIRLNGVIRSLPPPDGLRLNLENDGFLVPVDAGTALSAFDGLEIGCRVEVTGICNINVAESSQGAPLPHIDGFSVILRRAGDLVVLERPPWWTPRRLLYLVGALLAALVGILIWNLILNRLVERRSRELMRTRIARDEANLKTEERMRLAVELHDTIAQDMTGVAMQIDAAEMASECDPAGLQSHLVAARQRMHSCRENLRNCLWDLRNRPFETRHLSDAIRRTVAPHQGDAQVDIRCPLACRDLSDNTIHAVLCILRELVINAVRHGRATRIAISVGRGDDGLALHVSDNGAGFDPLDRPGPAQGHFGLLGVSERVNRLGGSLKLDSACGRGTEVTISNINPES